MKHLPKRMIGLTGTCLLTFNFAITSKIIITGEPISVLEFIACVWVTPVWTVSTLFINHRAIKRGHHAKEK